MFDSAPLDISLSLSSLIVGEVGMGAPPPRSVCAVITRSAVINCADNSGDLDIPGAILIYLLWGQTDSPLVERGNLAAASTKAA